MSPPVVTAGTDSAEVPVTDLVIIATQDPQVLSGLEFIRVGMSVNAPKVHIHTEIVRLPTFPIDRVFMGDLIQVLASEDIESLPSSMKVILERHGILEQGRIHYYLSDYGRLFIDTFL